MVKFEPIRRKPGELIRSEDWNKMQEDIRADLVELEDMMHKLKEYIDSLTETVVMTNLQSPTGFSYNLNEDVPGETGNYATSVVGHITKQWVLGKGKTGEICRFGILNYFDMLYYWAGAYDGDKKTLEITLEYVDGTIYTFRDLFIHECKGLRVKGTSNPYVEYLLSPNERVWYKYELKNPNPGKEVRYIIFRDTNEECAPRIGNVIQIINKLKPILK